MTAADDAAVTVEAIRARLEAATPGPWYRRSRMALGGVGPKFGRPPFGADECAYCRHLGPPIWEGRTDINGRRMSAHVHIDPDSYYTGHGIFAWPSYPSPDERTVCGNYDYEEGGVVGEADAEFVAHAPEGMAFLLAENARKDAIVEQVEAMAKWLRERASSRVSAVSADYRSADLLDAILAGDTGRLPWGGE